jgi:hypothetical protein
MNTGPIPNRLSSLTCQSIMTSIMQNKPNFQDAQMNVSIFSQMAYEYKHNWTLSENKPNQTQFRRFIYSAVSVFLSGAIRAVAYVTWLSTIFSADFQPDFLILTKKTCFIGLFSLDVSA